MMRQRDGPAAFESSLAAGVSASLTDQDDSSFTREAQPTAKD